MFQSLQHTLALPPEQWRVLDKVHSERNRTAYEGQFEVDQALVDAITRVAAEVERRLREALKGAG